MIYVKSMFGGVAAVLLSFVLLILWVILRSAPGTTVGFSPSLLLVPQVMGVVLAIFSFGSVLVWVVVRQKQMQ